MFVCYREKNIVEHMIDMYHVVNRSIGMYYCIRFIEDMAKYDSKLKFTVQLVVKQMCL